MCNYVQFCVLRICCRSPTAGLCSCDMAGKNFHRCTISINSEEISLLNSREHISVPAHAQSDPRHLQMVITF